MANPNGLFLALEGPDGSSQATQFEMLANKLRDHGYEVLVMDFPRYYQPSSYFAQRYQEGAYGDTDDIGPYSSSLFFALDRFEAASEIRQALNEGKIVLANSFTGSTMAQLGTKLNEAEQRRGFFVWLDNLEFEILKIPRPDKNLVLRTSNPTSAEPTDKIVQAYDDLCQLFPKDFRPIDCVRDDKLLDPETIHRLIWQTIEPDLPASPESPDSGVKPIEEPTEASSAIVQMTVSNLLRPYLLNQGYKQADNSSKLDFFTPDRLNKKTAELYRRTMQVLLDTHKDISAKLTDYNQTLRNPLPETYIRNTADLMLPLAVKVPLVADSPKQTPEYFLDVINLPEAQLTEGNTLKIKGSPHDLSAKISSLAGNFIENNYDQAIEGVDLVVVTPRNELDLVSAILFQYAHNSSDKLASSVAEMPYVKKEKLLKTYLSSLSAKTNSGHSILQEVNYSWDILSSYQVMMDLLSEQPGRDFQMQLISPRYGYDVPVLIDDAGLTDQFLVCFDASLELHSAMQASTSDNIAQYAVLQGHRLRWKITYNAQEMAKILTTGNSAQTEDYSSNQLLEQFREKLAEVHPLLSENLIET